MPTDLVFYEKVITAEKKFKAAGSRFINQDLARHFPGYLEEFFWTLRTKAAYLALLSGPDESSLPLLFAFF